MKMHVIIESRGQVPRALPWISAQRLGNGNLDTGQTAKSIGARATTAATFENNVWYSSAGSIQLTPVICP